MDLECPCCFKIPNFPPLWQCKNGHLVCDDCKNCLGRMHLAMVQCPTCRILVGDVWARNLIAEKLIKSLPNYCDIFDCGEEIPGGRKEFEKHQNSCKFRLVTCPGRECNQKINISKLIEHMKKNHTVQLITKENTKNFTKGSNKYFKDEIKIRPEVLVDDYDATMDPLLLNFDGYDFLFYVWRDSRRKMLHFWTYIVGSKDEAEKYYSFISITSGDQPVSFYFIFHSRSVHEYQSVI